MEEGEAAEKEEGEGGGVVCGGRMREEIARKS